MSVSFPSGSGGASYDPSTYLTSPAAAIADPVDTVDLTSVGKAPAVASPSAGSANASSAAASASNAKAWHQEYENFVTDNTTFLLENTFNASPSSVTASTLGVLSQAAALQNPQTLAFQEPSTGSTVDTTA